MSADLRDKEEGDRAMGVPFQRTAELNVMMCGTLEKGEWSGVAEAKGTCWKLTVPGKSAWKSALGPS